jgi:hypothetical protein
MESPRDATSPGRSREFDLADPAVKAKMRERYGTHLPLDEPVISPAAIYDSHLLKTISD